MNQRQITLTLQAERVSSVRRHHPWIFGGAFTRDLVEDTPRGTVVRIADPSRNIIGVGTYNAGSKIRVRLYRFEDGELDEEFFAGRITAAISRRETLFGHPHRVGRLVFGEADGLPGFIVDRYNEIFVVQVSTAGAELLREPFLAALTRVTDAKVVFERSDVGERAKEGIDERKGAILGTPNVPTVVKFPGGLRLEADPVHGQKTGLFLDQAANWERVAHYATGRDVLDLHCYAGGFGVAAARFGAKRVVHVDSSVRALEAVERNHALNPGKAAHELVHGDVTESLARFREEGRSFGLIILDPPSLARQARDLEKAMQVYRHLNSQALKVLSPGGILASFSCSGAVEREALRGAVASAAAGQRIELQWLETLGASPDHPVVTTFPEGDYLHGVVVRRV